MEEWMKTFNLLKKYWWLILMLAMLACNTPVAGAPKTEAFIDTTVSANHGEFFYSAEVRLAVQFLDLLFSQYDNDTIKVEVVQETGTGIPIEKQIIYIDKGTCFEETVTIPKICWIGDNALISSGMGNKAVTRPPTP